MNILYRLFYTVFSMSLIGCAVIPIGLLLRGVLHHMPKKLTVALWTIVFVRLLCPVGMTSPICLLQWCNRSYHLILRSVGVEITPDHGLMNSWINAYQGDIATTIPYRVCTIIWTVAVASIILFTIIRQVVLRYDLKHSACLFDNVYQSVLVKEPVVLGVICPRIYLPAEMGAKESQMVLRHTQMHCSLKDAYLRTLFFVVLCIHWYHPFVWCAYYFAMLDMEMAYDESVVSQLGWDSRMEYVQCLANMNKGEGILTFSAYSKREISLEPRKLHILYLQKSNRIKSLVVVFGLSVLLFAWFASSALYNTWTHSAWGQQRQTESLSLFDDDAIHGISGEMISEVTAKTPDGLDVKVQLVVTDGVYQKSEGYTGKCELRMIDTYDNVVNRVALHKLYPQTETQHFNEVAELVVSDYNQDGIQEVAIGQSQKVSEKALHAVATGSAVDVSTEKASALPKGTESVSATALPKGTESSNAESVRKIPTYYLLNIEEDKLVVASDPIYISNVNPLQEASMIFTSVENTTGILSTQIDKEKAYYVWNVQKKKYKRKSLTPEEPDAYSQSMASGQVLSGEIESHTLQNENGDVKMQVDTQTDSTGSSVIKDVIYEPEGLARQADRPTGYYCDIQWAATASGTSDQYAILTYNGSKSQTFVVYDTKSRETLYQQEDGSQVLGDTFRQYNGKEISFDEGGVVVYSLMEMADDDTLSVSFAAEADGGLTVKGSYQYVISTGRTKNLEYSQDN